VGIGASAPDIVGGFEREEGSGKIGLDERHSTYMINYRS
jgi:hypothetical protein